jgi:hypothetical protein
MQFPFASLVVAAALATPALATAQRPIVLPAEYDLAWGRGSSAALGGNSTRTQMVFAQPFALSTPVFGVGLRRTAATTDGAPFTADIEVRMSSTASVPGALSSTFANNVGSDMVVSYPRQMLNVPAMPANRSTGLFAQVPFSTPFIFGTNSNTNIVVDLLVYGRSTGATWSTDRGFASANGRATNAGIGCGAATVSSSSTTPAYVAGSTITVTLASATPSSVAILIMSGNMKELIPGVMLPFDLSLIGGLAGCQIMVDPTLLTIALPTSATGAASTSLGIPLGFGRIGTGWQWLYLVPPSPANPIGLETTANRAIWIGPEVIVPNAQYVWDLSNVNSATGTSTTDSVPVVQFLIP